MLIKVIVACRDANGVPAFCPIKVECGPEAYDGGDHYDAAKEKAEELGYEDAKIAYDENDGPAWLFGHFDWHRAEVTRT